MSSTQWQRLLKNEGIWQGSFTVFSPTAQEIKNTPSQLILKSSDNEKTLKLTVTKFDSNSQPYESEFTYLNRNIYLFPEGHFAKGSTQFSPYAIFGAEYGFLTSNRRCRLVQLYDPDSQLETVTLIREFRENSNASECPLLSIEQLIGEWEGEAHTVYSDWYESKPYPTKLKIEKQGTQIIQTTTAPEFNFTSTGTLQNSYVSFPKNDNEIRVLLLPDGVSTALPLKIHRNQPFMLEFGWLVAENRRLRLIRQYDEKGAWRSITLINEYKKSQTLHF